MKPSDNEIEMLAAGFAIQHKNGLIRFAHALLDKYAPQASAEIGVEEAFAGLDSILEVRNAALEEAAKEMDRLHAENRRWHNEFREAAAIVRALKQPQADKDGGQQRAGDVDVGRLMAAAKGMTRLYSYVWDRTDGCLVVFSENVRAFDAAFDALRLATGEAVDDAAQAGQGERDE